MSCEIFSFLIISDLVVNLEGECYVASINALSQAASLSVNGIYNHFFFLPSLQKMQLIFELRRCDMHEFQLSVNLTAVFKKIKHAITERLVFRK